MPFPRRFKTANVRFDVTDIEELVEKTKELSKLKVSVGVNKGRNKKWRNKLALWHEFGTGIVPARPFLRPTKRWIERNIMPEVLGEIMNFALARRHKTYIGPKRMTWFARKKLSEAGDGAVEFMKARILLRIPPPLKRATVKRKIALKFPFPNIPLIATGNLYQSIGKRIIKRK